MKRKETKKANKRGIKCTEFQNAVNRTLKASSRHTSFPNVLRHPVSLLKIAVPMRYLLFVGILLSFGQFISAQTPQPTTVFPFQVGLFTPDSTATSSPKVLEKGKITVLAFWLSTCLPCQIELATYSKKYAEWKQQADFQLIAISIDYPQRFQQMARMAQSSGWAFPAYWDSIQAFRDILPGGLNGLPQVFLFDKNGQLVWQHKRYVTGDEQELLAKILEVQAAGH